MHQGCPQQDCRMPSAALHCVTFYTREREHSRLTLSLRRSSGAQTYSQTSRLHEGETITQDRISVRVQLWLRGRVEGYPLRLLWMWFLSP